MALNELGTLLATASEKVSKILSKILQGTIVKLFETKKGDQLKAFRRGAEITTINDLMFDSESRYITCCSSK